MGGHIFEQVRDNHVKSIMNGKRHFTYELQKIHMFKINGNVYVWSSAKKEACEMSILTIKVIEMLQKGSKSFESIYDEMYEVISVSDLEILLNELEEVGIIERNNYNCKPISSFNLILTTKCNLNCLYCYGGNGKISDMSGGSYGMEQLDMQPEIGYQVVDYLLKTASMNKHGEIGGISFFGGEPLVNKSTMKSILEYSEKQAKLFGVDIPKFSITTNGTLIDDEFISMCKYYRMSVQLSFDGLKTTQDRLRIYKNGNASSYDTCVKAFELFNKNKIAIRIRATITKSNINLMEVIENLEALNVKQVHFAPASISGMEDIGLNENDFERIISEYNKISDYMLKRIADGKEFVNCTNITGALSQIHRKSNKTFCCGAGIGLVSVAPDGQLFICHRFTGDHLHSIGSINEGILFQKRYEFIKKLHMDSHTACADCWCKDLCGGECPYSNYMETGCLNTPASNHCKLHKGITEIAIHFASELRKNHIDHYWKYVSE